MNIKKPIKSRLLLFCLVFGMSKLALANTPPTNLTLHVATMVLPSGATFEWHNALPISPSTLEPTPAAVSPGIYYAVYNFGNGCYSTPTPIKVVSNNCPILNLDLNESVDSTNKPSNTVLSYHSALPASLANKISNANTLAATPGTYFATFYDASTTCYTQASVIVFVGTTCGATPTNLPTLVNSTTIPLGATVEWTDSLGNPVTDPANAPPGLYTAQYNFGNGCFSTPTKIRVTTNVCPALTANITAFVDSTNKPSNTQVTYHTDLPVSNTNKLTTAQAMVADSGTYYVAYYDLDGMCYTQPSAIVVAFTNCINIPLDVNQVDFALIANDCNVALNWKVENQDNLNYYGVMRKAEDERDFAEIAQIKVDEFKTLPAQYTFESKNLESKNYLFKIKLVDFASSSKYSKAISTKLNCEINSISVYPNPVNNTVNIRINTTEPQMYEVKIMDITGRTIISDKIDLKQNNTELKYDLSNYADGIYNVVVTNAVQRKLFKIQKLN